MSDKIVPLGPSGHHDFALKYTNYRTRQTNPTKMSMEGKVELNNERYEGYMRSDFSAPKLPLPYLYDKVEVIKL